MLICWQKSLLVSDSAVECLPGSTERGWFCANRVIAVIKGVGGAGSLCGDGKAILHLAINYQGRLPTIAINIYSQSSVRVWVFICVLQCTALRMGGLL